MIRHIRETVSTLAGAAALFLVLRSFAFATYHIPTESMVPTLEVGERIAATKFPLGFSRYSFPFGGNLPPLPGENGRIPGAVPKRGDVVVFRHPKTGDDWVKRVIGLPGDTIALQSGQIILNGTAVPRQKFNTWTYRDQVGLLTPVTLYSETFPDGRSHIVMERKGAGHGRDMATVTVPAGHVFMMGDNRDNSADSRFSDLGFVPIENMLGRADMILYSLSQCETEPGLHCPEQRFFQAVK